LRPLEIIQPVAGTTIHSEHLKTRGPGLHHLGVYVDSLPKATHALSGRGYRKIMEGQIDRLCEFAYFEATEMHCILEPLHLSIELPLFLAGNAQSYP
jgi:Glyoxalase/Bleomycin resistance protein/Dioxygenase superfamily